MAQLTLPILAADLELTALVNVGKQRMEELVQTGQALPRAVVGKAVIDTCSTLTCVAPAVARQLGLTPIGRATSQTALGQMKANVYRVSLSLLDSPTPVGPLLTFGEMDVLELPTAPGVAVLVGMDVILACKLFVDGPARSFVLEV